MTYFGVLTIFILPPLLALVALVPRDLWHRLFRRTGPVNWLAYAAVVLHVVIAVVYTTPWDNYLVANRVWWYDPELVTGITLGWVPIEEYTFFVVQSLLTGLWTLALLRSVFTAPENVAAGRNLRRTSALLVLGLWLVSVALLVSSWTPGRYLALILVWGLPPVLVQVWFGADILRAHWRLLALAISLPTLYLWLVDALAINSGTWTIDPAQTTGLKLWVLPIEEMLFFLITNVLLVFGVTLVLSPESQRRLRDLVTNFKRIDLPAKENGPAAT
ncbi:MAG: lycopene cyclase domain-containing protein [Anaerolineales bacterium]|nr:lycopene cyclase domain-containing protein [Anaerolineales bacterium]